MYYLKHIKDTTYYAISNGDRDPWVMKPIPADKCAYRSGVTSAGLAWFFDPREGLFVYDIQQQSLLYRKRLPNALSDAISGDGTRIDFSSRHYELLQNQDATQLYYLVDQGRKLRHLHVVEICTGDVVRSDTSLPGGFHLSNHCRLDSEGRIVFSAVIGDKLKTGLVLVDPTNCDIETSICEVSHSSNWLHSPSPNGKYWLRNDNSQLPYTKIAKRGFPIIGFGAKRNLAKEYFSFAIEIWSSFPLRHVATVAPMWMTPHELPDGGGLDQDLYLDPTRDRSVDIGTWLEKKPAKRTKLFRDMSVFLQQNPEKNWSSFSHFKEGETEWLWNDQKTYYSNVGSNLSDLEFRPDDLIGWQPDSEAFWVKRNWFVSCVGVDGSVSPKINFERFGMNTGTWRPCATSFKSAFPHPERQLELRYENASVVADGSAEAPTTAVRTVSKANDQHSILHVDEAEEQEKKLAEKADTLARKASTIRIQLKSMDEDDCIAAIDQLTANITPDINQRPYDNQLEAVFVLGRKKLNEQNFFKHIEQNCSKAAPALQRLLAAICENFTSLDSAYYDPYEDKTGTSVGAFGFAALCLAKLDPNSNKLLQRYGGLIDTYHEHFYLPNIFAVMLRNESDNKKRLTMAENALLAGLGNNFGPYGFWKFAEMEKLAKGIFEPAEYAKRISELDMQRQKQDLNANLLGPTLVRLGAEMQERASDWENAMLQELEPLVL